jgi:uncharacterized protein YecE (DUF72 family)
MPRAITHELKLRDCREKLDFFLNRLAPLGSRIGCVLIQLPLAFNPRHDEAALRSFVRSLPGDFRFAIEFPHHDWHLPRIANLLGEYAISWVWNDISTPGQQSRAAFEFFPQTADFLYIRLMGDPAAKFHDASIARDSGGLLWPRDASIESWALKIKNHLQECRRVFIFAGNHFEGASPLTCRRIALHFNLEIHLPEIDPAKRTPPVPQSSQLNLL